MGCLLQTGSRLGRWSLATAHDCGRLCCGFGLAFRTVTPLIFILLGHERLIYLKMFHNVLKNTDDWLVSVCLSAWMLV